MSQNNNNAGSKVMTSDKKLVLRLGKDSIRQQRFQISILKPIADLFNIKPNMTCKVRLLTPEIAKPQGAGLQAKQNQSIIGDKSLDVSLNQSVSMIQEEVPSIATFVPDRVEITFRD